MKKLQQQFIKDLLIKKEECNVAFTLLFPDNIYRTFLIKKSELLSMKIKILKDVQKYLISYCIDSAI